MAIYELRTTSSGEVLNLISWDGITDLTLPSGTQLIEVTGSTSSSWTGSFDNITSPVYGGNFYGNSYGLFEGEVSGSFNGYSGSLLDFVDGTLLYISGARSGNFTGSLSGSLTGSFEGNASGSFTGSFSGSRVISDIAQIQNALIVSGALNITGSFIINGSSYTDNTSGTSGTSGTDGTSGTSGMTGATGPKGDTGDPGSSGTSGTSGTPGSSGTSGIGTPGSSGTSGTSGTGFSTVSNFANDRILTSDGTTNAANAEANLTFTGTNLYLTGSFDISGSITMNSNALNNPLLTGYYETMITKSVANDFGGGIVNIDLKLGNVHKLLLDANVMRLNISNNPAAGQAGSFVLVLEGDGTARTFSWGTEITWPNGAPSVVTTDNNVDIYSFITFNQTEYVGFVIAQNQSGLV